MSHADDTPRAPVRLVVRRSIARLRRRAAAALRRYCGGTAGPLRRRTFATQKRTSLIQVSHVSFQRSTFEAAREAFRLQTALAGARASELDSGARMPLPALRRGT